MKNIVFVNDLRKEKGGPSTFQKLLLSKIKNKINYSFLTNYFKFYDFTFIINASNKFFFIIIQKLINSKIILRLGTPEFYLLDHSYFHYKRIKHIIEIIYLQFLKIIADIIIYQSKDTQKKWRKITPWTLNNKEKIIYNGCEDHFYGYYKKKSDTLVFFVIEGSNTVIKKNFLFQFLDFLKNTNIKHRVEIFGYTSVEFKNKLKSYENININGFIKKNLLRKKIKLCDYMIFTDNVSAGCPNSVIESLSAGIPIIARNEGVISEIVNNKCGLLLNLNESNKSIHNKFNNLINNYSKFRKASRHQWEKKFTLNKTINNYIKILS